MKGKLIFQIFASFILIVFFLSFVLALVGVLYGGGLAKVVTGTPLFVDAWGVKKKVTNNGALGILVPAGTSLEWSEFRTNYPSSVVISDYVCYFSSDCSSGYYCYSDNLHCYNLPTCAEANTYTGYNVQESNEDLWNDCPTTGCYTGYCSGTSYSCAVYTDGLRHACPTGFICDDTGTCFEDSCFIPETNVLMSDGTYKKIVDIKKGEKVQGETQVNEVLGMYIHDFSERDLYSINGGDYFVTEEHPFKTITGWKSINPKRLYQEDEYLFKLLDPKVLRVGDVLITENGYVVVKTIESKYVEVEMKVYNLILEGDHTYYADGYLVHNIK
ncbi:hypothetical protein GW932_03015 [archaeon]|nr:hypothetical protein [archaeon]